MCGWKGINNQHILWRSQINGIRNPENVDEQKKIAMSICGNASFAKHWTQNNWSDFSAFLASQQSWHWPSFCALVWSGSVCTHSKTKQMQQETWIKTHRWRWNLSTDRFNLFFVVMDFKQHNQMFMLVIKCSWQTGIIKHKTRFSEWIPWCVLFNLRVFVISSIADISYVQSPFAICYRALSAD